MNKYILLITIPFLLFNGAFANDIINDNTEASFIFSTTPTYRSIYPMEILNVNVSCDADAIESKDKTELPIKTLFRKTFDANAQTENEMVVHVYSVPGEPADLTKITDTYFKKPFNMYVWKKLYSKIAL